MGSQRVWRNWATLLSLSFGVKKLSFFLSLFFLPFFFSVLFTPHFHQSLFSAVAFFLFPTTHRPASFFLLHPGTHLSRSSTRRASDLIGSHHLLSPSKSPWSRDGRYQTGTFILWWNSDYLAFQREFGCIRTVERGNGQYDTIDLCLQQIASFVPLYMVKWWCRTLDLLQFGFSDHPIVRWVF